MSSRVCALTASLLIIGCSSESSKSAPSARGSAQAGPVATAPSAMASLAAPSSSAAATENDTGYTIVAEGTDLRIYPLGANAILDAGAFYAVLGEGTLEQDPLLTKTALKSEGGSVTVSTAVRYNDFFGVYPTQLIARGETMGGLFARVGDTFADQNPLRDGEALLDITAWGDKRAIAAIRMAQPDIRFVLVNSAAGGSVPAPGKANSDQTDCAVRMDSMAELKLAGLPTGQLFAAGRECQTNKPVVERWDAGQVRGVSEAFNDVPVGADAVAIVALAPNEAYAAFAHQNRGFLASWDGSTWKVEPAMFGVPTPRGLFASGDGVVWAVGSEGFYKHTRGEAWTRVALPGNAKPTSAWASSSKNVWVVLEGKRLARMGGTVEKPLKLVAASEIATTLERDKRWPATEACKKVYVLLAALEGATGPVPTTHPSLSSAVKDDPELKALEYGIEELDGVRWLGGKAPSLEVGTKLSGAFSKVQKAAPLITCGDPTFKSRMKIE